MKFTPYWTDQFPRPETLKLSELPDQVDVAVVGSGYTGLNAAIELAKAGAVVVVLDQETIGWGASSRNGTMLTPGLKAKLKDITRWYGDEMAHDFWQWSVDAVHHVTNIIREEKIDCDYEINGMVYLATKPTHADGVKGYGEYLREHFGYTDTFWVPKERLHEEIGSSAFHGALVSPLGSRLQPAKYVFGLAEVAARYGANLVEYAGVRKISRNKRGFLVETAKGSLLAKEVLLATGGYTTAVVPKARYGVFPVGSYIIVTEPLSAELQAELSPNDRVFYDSKIFLNYFCLTPDGRMMLGGRANLSPNLDLEKTTRLLHSRLQEIFPQLKEIPLTHSWTGKLGVSFDQMPHIGVANSVHYAYGYSGHGISIGSYLGKEVGELLAGKRSSSPFMEIRHPRRVFALLDPLYLPFVSAYFKLRDSLS
jgi:glycine/D-amino acid oxidase-like deaminating enzyme